MTRFFAAGLALLWQASAIQAQVSADHEPASLDRLLAAKDYVALGTTIANVSRPEDARSDLDWLKDRMMAGNTAFVTMLYSRLLWVATSGLAEADKDGLRQTAAMTTLYAYAAILIDGQRCGDKTAPSKRLTEIMRWNPEIWPFIRSLPDQDRHNLVRYAVALEARTAAQRDQMGDVDFLCRAGMEETQYNLKNGTAREVPTAKGQIGRTVELTGDGKYVPSVRAEAEWREEAATIRQQLPDMLAKLTPGMQPGPDAAP